MRVRRVRDVCARRVRVRDVRACARGEPVGLFSANVEKLGSDEIDKSINQAKTCKSYLLETSKRPERRTIRQTYLQC